MASDERLFSGRRLAEVTHGLTREMYAEIEQFDADALLNTSAADLVRYFQAKFALDAPSLQEDTITSEHAEHAVDVSHDQLRHIRDRSRPFHVPGVLITFHIPYSGDGTLFRYEASSSFTVAPQGRVVGGEILVSFARTDFDAQAVTRAFQQDLEYIRQSVEFVRRDVEEFNSSIAYDALGRIQQRRERLLQARKMASALPYPIHPRADAPRTYAVPDVRRKPPVQRPTVTTTPFKPEPTLPDAEYENILRIISNMAQVLERSPAAFAGMGEEDLRQHFLVQLNGHYEGQATGETFNAQGKTDILIRAEGANVFIAECKFWKGAQAFSETITQLLGYVTWRDTKTALIVFNRNKDLSAVLAAVGETVPKHPNYKRPLTTGSETAFRYVFHSPTDINREVTVAVLVFDVPTK